MLNWLIFPTVTSDSTYWLRRAIAEILTSALKSLLSAYRTALTRPNSPTTFLFWTTAGVPFVALSAMLGFSLSFPTRIYKSRSQNSAFSWRD